MILFFKKKCEITFRETVVSLVRDHIKGDGILDPGVTKDNTISQTIESYHSEDFKTLWFKIENQIIPQSEILSIKLGDVFSSYKTKETKTHIVRSEISEGSIRQFKSLINEAFCYYFLSFYRKKYSTVEIRYNIETFQIVTCKAMVLGGDYQSLSFLSQIPRINKYIDPTKREFTMLPFFDREKNKVVNKPAGIEIYTYDLETVFLNLENLMFKAQDSLGLPFFETEKEIL